MSGPFNGTWKSNASVGAARILVPAGIARNCLCLLLVWSALVDKADSSLFIEGAMEAATADMSGESFSCIEDESLTPSSLHPPRSTSNFSSYPTGNDNIQDFLNPQLFRDPSTIQRVKQLLREGRAVVIRNAFRHDYALAVYDELVDNLDRFKLQEFYDERTLFSLHHHNIIYDEDFTSLMNATNDLFNSPGSKAFMASLSGRDCSGGSDLSASWFKAGDYSMPHSDYHLDRTVTYVWHLTKNWKDGWGGAMYWCSEHPQRAWIPPSFNTLVLFSVSALSHHLVTTVSPLSQNSLRLAVTGWFTDTFVPSFETDAADSSWLDYYLSHDGAVTELTVSQYYKLRQMGEICWMGNQPAYVSVDRCDEILSFVGELVEVLSPELGSEVALVELK